MKFLTWLIGLVILALVFAWILTQPFSFLVRCLYVLLLSSLLCLYRILRGPTAADRAVAIDILGILIIGFCGVLALATGRHWYLDIGIAWGLQSFIGILAIAKYLEGRSFDD
jgi:multicomponent Na+:H+ antiporter subunit F